MNNYTADVHGGVNIVPSARKSIHSHCSSCRCNFENMGKHGLPKRRQKKLENSRDGVDEIDNVMSKMCRQASPIPTRKTSENIIGRRNSYDNYSTDSDEDDENLLSKSSPPTFSYSSEELYASALQNELQRSRNESYSSNNSYHMNNISPPRQHINRNNDDFTRKQQNINDTHSTNMIFKIMVAIVVLIVAFVTHRYFPSNPVESNVYDKFNLDADVIGLKEKYKVADNSLLQVKTGIVTISQKQDTASFIFTYDSEQNGFNAIEFNSFIEDIASTSSRYLRNKTHELYTMVDTSNLKMRTEKEFMNHFIEGVSKSGVMLVKDIDSVPSQLAMAFHYYCDEYDPLVKQSAIFFTLNLAKCSNSSEKKSTHEYIEKCLAKKWNTVDQDKITPLLTRVVNIVIDVTQTF